MNLPKTILVPTDFSEHADQALEYAAALGVQLGATLHLLHVVSIVPGGVPELGVAYSAVMIDSLTKEGQAALEARAARYRDRVALGATRLEVGDARDTIDRVASELDADLIVMGTHGRRGIRRILLGSVAETVVRSAPCPVLTIRPKLS